VLPSLLMGLVISGVCCLWRDPPKEKVSVSFAEREITEVLGPGERGLGAEGGSGGGAVIRGSRMAEEL
jgi:hypothetical protein